jgi:hypothetical protein
MSSTKLIQFPIIFQFLGPKGLAVNQRGELIAVDNKVNLILNSTL